MTQPKIALFFAMLFMALNLLPSVLMLADKECDIAMYFDGSEEEEKKGNESPKDAEDKILPIRFASEYLEFKDRSNSIYHYSNFYPSEFAELISPPPEQYI